MAPLAAAFVAGLTAGSVALLSAVAVRRIVRRREERVFIDREPDSAELDPLPWNEANTPDPPRLESEVPEFSPESQRW